MKKKLTKEELLAGKCDPEETQPENVDPRLRNPDELLLKLLAQKRAQNPAATVPKPTAEKQEIADVSSEQAQAARPSALEQQPQSQAEKRDMIDDSASFTLNKLEPKLDLSEIQQKKWLALKEMYDRDMSRWKEYEQNVVHWRDKVLQIVQRLQNELSAAKGLKDEVEALKSVIQSKDEEIAKMKKAMANFLKNRNIDL